MGQFFGCFSFLQSVHKQIWPQGAIRQLAACSRQMTHSELEPSEGAFFSPGEVGGGTEAFFKETILFDNSFFRSATVCLYFF